jgi:uncharacterized protein (TIGR02687 family)
MGLSSEFIDVKVLLDQNRVVLWEVSPDFDQETARDVFFDVSIIDSANGFLGTNLSIRGSESRKLLILLWSSVDSDDSLAISLRSRFFEYRTTTEAQILKGLGWPSRFESWVKTNHKLLLNDRFLAKFKKIDTEGLTPDALSEAVLLSLFRVDERSSVGFSLALLSIESSELDYVLGAIEGTTLQSLLWEKVSREVGYSSNQPGLEDMRAWLAQTSLTTSLLPHAEVTTSAGHRTSAEYFLQELKLRHPAAYFTFCESDVASLFELGQIQNFDILRISQVQHVATIDRFLLEKCLSELIDQPSSLTSTELSTIIKNRQRSAWYANFQDGFDALFRGAKLLELTTTLDFHCPDFASGISRYVESWYEVDFAYRKFVLSSKGKTDIDANLGRFSELVESAYVNAYQNKLGENWQLVVNELKTWSKAEGVTFAREFFDKFVLLPFSGKKLRIAVIISDALRYEVGAEASQTLARLGYDIELRALVAPLPSYTQLGMAALLPNKEISLRPESKTVLVDGESTSGLENRKKILLRSPGSPASAMDFEALVTDNDLSRSLKDFKLWYFYHNKIDKTGDSAASEGGVFDAVEDTLEDLKLAVKKLKTAGFDKIFITADHGFLYQDSVIAEHGFLSTVPEGDATEFINRRFVIGNGLQPASGLKHFTSSALGYSCAYEIQIPGSTLRLRRKGSGLRFVHGGATLQEVVIPLLELSKVSQKIVEQVDVVLSPGVSTRITTGLVALSFTQKDPISEDLLPRELRVAIYSGDQRISTLEIVSFALTDPEIRNRFHSFTLNMTNDLSKSGQKSAVLKVESRIGQTERWAPYDEIEFELANLAEKDF